MATKASRKRKAMRVGELLAAEYGRPSFTPRADETAVDQLVRTVLSQKTTSAACHAAFENLREACGGSWEAAIALPTEAIALSIAGAGLANQKAPRIQAILREIEAREETVSLAVLDDLDDDAAYDYLVSLPGVGPKTAHCTMMFALGRRVLPVDTHVFRVSRRLGLLDEDVPLAKAHRALAPLVDPEERYAMHVNQFEHGRRVCRSQRPRCGECILSGVCDDLEQRRARGE